MSRADGTGTGTGTGSGAGYGMEAFRADTGVSRETLDRFELWRTRLEAENAHTNLVGRSTLADFWFRHALDSWQVFTLGMANGRTLRAGPIWAPGPGFPGLRWRSA